MNVITGKTPLVKLRGFRGLYSRGSDYVCPPDHLTDCYNCSFPGPGQVSIRENCTIQNDIATRTIISFAIATLSGGPVLLTLSSDGKLYDETANSLLATFTNATDFVCLSIFGRCYISPKKDGRALAGSHIYWYDGVTFHAIGWDAPVTTLTLTQPNAGTVDTGVHTLAVSFISPTGFLTKPSPFSAINSDGTHTISISTIPLGAAGTTGRVLFITKANEGELFFIPGGTINDNTTTTFEYTDNDTSLLESADYLLDILYPVPAAAALKFYSGRLVAIGRESFPDAILVSNQADPETFNLVNNVVNVPVDFGSNSSAGGMVIRDILYITKPNGTYSVQDNGDNPNTWHVSTVDSGIGAFDTGISVFASSMSSQDVFDTSFIAHKTGLLLFNGSYQYPPLTYKIESIWQKIDQNDFKNVQVAHDVWTKRAYIAVPLTGAGSAGGRITKDPGGVNNLILMMDYQEGLTPDAVRWTVWTPPGPYKKIAVENFLLNYTSTPIIYQFAYANGTTKIRKIIKPSELPALDTDVSAPASTADYTAIQQYIITAPVSPGGITAFSGLMLFFNIGNKAVTPALMNKSRVVGPVNQRTFALDAYDAEVELFRGINFQHNGLELVLSCSVDKSGAIQGYFHLTGIDVYGTVMYAVAPAGTQIA